MRELYGAPQISERHRHRYEVNNAYRAQLTQHVHFRFSGDFPEPQFGEGRARRIR